MHGMIRHTIFTRKTSAKTCFVVGSVISKDCQRVPTKGTSNRRRTKYSQKAFRRRQQPSKNASWNSHRRSQERYAISWRSLLTFLNLNNFVVQLTKKKKFYQLLVAINLFVSYFACLQTYNKYYCSPSLLAYRFQKSSLASKSRKPFTFFR